MQSIRECSLSLEVSDLMVVHSTNVTEASPTSLSSSPTGSLSASETKQSSHTTNAGAIAGGVVGGVVLVAALLLAYLWHRRSHQSRVVSPFNVEKREQQPTIFEHDNEAKVADIGQGTKGPDNVPSLAHSMSRGESSSSSAAESTQLSETALRQSLQALRAQVDVARAERGMSAASIHPSQVSSSGKLSKASALESEILSLRAEVLQLRAQQDRRDSTPAPVSPVTTDLIREIALLRAEMDEMREINQGALPSYSPPARPLPGFPGQEFTL